MSGDAPVVAISVVARDADRVLLVRRARPPNAGAWALPGGKVELGERLVDAAAREVLEETGIVVDRLKRVDVAEVIDRDAAGNVISHHVIVVFEGRARPGRPAPADDADDAVWAAPADLDGVRLTDDTARVLRRVVPA